MALHIKKTVIPLDGLRVHTCLKVGTTSFLKAFSDIPLEYPDDPGEGYRFMVVRHPLDRLVSRWAMLQDTRKAEPFPRFLERVLSDPWQDTHTRPQVAYVGPVPMDELAPFEHLSRAWEGIRRRFSPLNLPRLGHHRASHHVPWEHHYNNTMRQSAEAIYADDTTLYQTAKRMETTDG